MDLIEILVGIRAAWLGWAPVPGTLPFSYSVLAGVYDINYFIISDFMMV
jgi:hypothetical protein